MLPFIHATESDIYRSDRVGPQTGVGMFVSLSDCSFPVASHFSASSSFLRASHEWRDMGKTIMRVILSVWRFRNAVCSCVHRCSPLFPRLCPGKVCLVASRRRISRPLARIGDSHPGCFRHRGISATPSSSLLLLPLDSLAEPCPTAPPNPGRRRARDWLADGRHPSTGVVLGA